MTTSLANRQIKNQAVNAPKTDPTIIIAAGTNPFVGDQSLGLHKLIDLAMPTAPGDAANKAYVDSVSGGVTQMSITSDTFGLKLVGDEAAPTDTKYYGTDSNSTLGYHDLPTSTFESEWVFSTSVTMADPGTGKFRTDHTLFSSSTQMALATVSNRNIDRTNVLKTIQVNDMISIQDKTNAVNWVRYRVTAEPTPQPNPTTPTWFLINIEMVDGGGTIPTNNSPTLFIFAASGGTTSYSDEQAMDAAVSLFAAGSHIGIEYSYDDTGNKLNSIVTGAPWGGIVGKPTTLAGYGITDAQPLDPDLTNLAGLIITGNALKVIRVNAAETGYELATVASGGGGTASVVTVSNNTTLNATVYPLWATVTGDVPLFISTTKISLNPNLGNLTIAGLLTASDIQATGTVNGQTVNASASMAVGTIGSGLNGAISFKGGVSGSSMIMGPDNGSTGIFWLPINTGAAGQVLQATGPNGSAWSSPSMPITDNSMNGVVYPIWAQGTGSVPLRVTVAKWNFNPSSGNMILGGSFSATSVTGTNQLVAGTVSQMGLLQLMRGGGLNKSLIIRPAAAMSNDVWIDFPSTAGGAQQVLRNSVTPGLLEWIDPALMGTVSSDITSGRLAVQTIGTLSVGLNTPSGLDPSESTPVFIIFRDPALNSSGYELVRFTTSVAVTISNGSTLGIPGPNIPFRLWVVAFRDGAFVRLGIVNLPTFAINSGGSYTLQSLRQLSDDTLDSAGLDDGSGAADQAGTIYTTFAVAGNKAMRILGYLQWSGGLDTPGFWDVAPDIIQMYGAHVPAPGSVLQKRRWLVTAGASGTVTMPFDATIPQDTEGNQFMVMDIAPKSSANILSIDALMFLTHSAIATMNSALFRRSGITTYPNARCSVASTSSVAGHVIQQRLKHMELSQMQGSSWTYSIRSGAAGAGTIYFNRTSALNNVHGGTCTSVMEIEEIMG